MTASRPLTDSMDAWEDWPPGPRRSSAARSSAARSSAARSSGVRSATAPRSRSPSRAAARKTPQPEPRFGERARRMRHVRALRRDLLVDFVAAFVVVIALLPITAGLGVVLLLEIPLAVAVVASFVIEYRRRRRR